MPLEELIRHARGDEPASLLLTNARVVNVLSGEVLETDVIPCVRYARPPYWPGARAPRQNHQRGQHRDPPESRQKCAADEPRRTVVSLEALWKRSRHDQSSFFSGSSSAGASSAGSSGVSSAASSVASSTPVADST